MINIVLMVMIVCFVMVRMIIAAQFEDLKMSHYLGLLTNRPLKTIYVRQSWEQKEKEFQHELLRSSNANLNKEKEFQ